MERKVTRAADLAPPRQISEQDFDVICRVHAIALRERAAVRAFLDDAVTGFGAVITREQMLPSRPDDRQAIARAIKHLRWTQRELTQRMGAAGRTGCRAAGRQIASAISISWIRKHFPGDRLTPAPIYSPPDDRDGREGFRALDLPRDTDNLSLDQRVRFMEHRGGEALAALIGDIVDALEDGRRAIVQLPPGRKPLEQRDYMLAALAEIWKRLGRKPTSGATSQFGAFCEAVFDAIGWPTTGVKAALAEVIKLRSQLYR
jgi:hypothetical protein